jgi:hypothetical protein
LPGFGKKEDHRVISDVVCDGIVMSILGHKVCDVGPLLQSTRCLAACIYAADSAKISDILPSFSLHTSLSQR